MGFSSTTSFYMGPDPHQIFFQRKDHDLVKAIWTERSINEALLASIAGDAFPFHRPFAIVVLSAEMILQFNRNEIQRLKSKPEKLWYLGFTGRKFFAKFLLFMC